jgi:hypothetical protein
MSPSKIKIPGSHGLVAYLITVAAWVVYVALQLMAPTNAQNIYHIHPAEITILQLTYLIPLLIIWLVAVYGASAFKHYADLLGNSKEGKAMHLIANALYWTIAYLVVASIFGSLLPFYTNSPGFAGLIILRDHLSALLTLVAFLLFYRGANLLRMVAKFETWTAQTFVILGLYLAFAAVLIWRFSLVSPSTAGTMSHSALQYVPSSVLLFTLLLPYLVAWFLGILAAVNLSKYAMVVKGVLYRKALGDLVKGIWSVVVFSIIVQILTLLSRALALLPLGSVLVLIYLIVLLYALGFVFVRAGAVKLARIEVAR